MLKINHKKAQAITELAVFGAILIYLLGTIVRSAVGNSLTQNQNFKAMRMALLSSWQYSQARNISRNSASILIVEDRLSPDFNKYGDLDRNPYIASGSGTFSYELLYPLTPGQDNMPANMPVMDVYINGQYFPFTMAAYRTYVTLPGPGDSSFSQPSGMIPGFPLCDGTVVVPYEKRPLKPGQCQQNQCLRYRRDWGVGPSGTSSEFGFITASQFENVIQPVTLTDSRCGPVGAPPTEAQRICQAQVNAGNIFALLTENPNPMIILGPAGILPFPNEANSSGTVNTAAYPSQWSAFETRYQSNPVLAGRMTQIQAQLNNMKTMFEKTPALPYKLFYTMVANPVIPQSNPATPVFSLYPPACGSHPCKDQELSGDLTLPGYAGAVNNTNGDLMFDLLRNGDSNTTIENQIPMTLRPYMAWQWAATAATSAKMIGLVTSTNQFPSYDIDGRLKEVTIYTFNTILGDPTVSYLDQQGGDIDTTWDVNSCKPKPGLQNNSEIYTFTENGTYLQIREGQLFNPENPEKVVRSATKRDTIDLIARSIQLSNNTGRFCSGTSPLGTVAGDGVTPNPVEVCAPGGSGINCFNTEHNVKSTCYDLSSNIIWVRSRLKDLRGHFWMTNTSGKLKVQR